MHKQCVYPNTDIDVNGTMPSYRPYATCTHKLYFVSQQCGKTFRRNTLAAIAAATASNLDNMLKFKAVTIPSMVDVLHRNIMTQCWENEIQFVRALCDEPYEGIAPLKHIHTKIDTFVHIRIYSLKIGNGDFSSSTYTML